MKTTAISTSRGTFGLRSFGSEDKPTIVCIHGWPETSYCWHQVGNILSSDYHVLCPDLRGAGHSERDLDKNSYTKEKLALDILELLDDQSISDFYLVGHDWGGAIAQEMAFIAPEKIKKLTIINMVIIHNKEGKLAAYKILGQYLFKSFWYQFFQSLKGLPEELIIGKEEVWVRYFMRGMENEVPEDAIQEYIKSYKKEGSITSAANLYRTMRKDMERWVSLEGKKINIPTMIIHGILDPVIIKEYFQGIDNCFKEVSIHSIKSGHFVMDEKPKEVANLLTAFNS